MIKFERKWILPLRCATDSVRNLIANSPKKKKKKKGDDNPIRLFYCNNIIHTYIIFIYRWRWVLPTMPT